MSENDGANVPYREPEMPRHERRVRWYAIAKWASAATLFLGALAAARSCYLYEKAHPGPTPPTEEDKRKDAEQEAIRSLRALFPDKEFSVHCAESSSRYHDYDCLSFIGNQKVAFTCEADPSPGKHKCNGFDFTAMTPAPGGTP